MANRSKAENAPMLHNGYSRAPSKVFLKAMNFYALRFPALSAWNKGHSFLHSSHLMAEKLLQSKPQTKLFKTYLQKSRWRKRAEQKKTLKVFQLSFGAKPHAMPCPTIAFSNIVKFFAQVKAILNVLNCEHFLIILNSKILLNINWTINFYEPDLMA